MLKASQLQPQHPFPLVHLLGFRWRTCFSWFGSSDCCHNSATSSCGSGLQSCSHGTCFHRRAGWFGSSTSCPNGVTSSCSSGLQSCSYSTSFPWCTCCSFLWRARSVGWGAATVATTVPPVSALGFKVAATAPVSPGALAAVSSGALASVGSGAATVATTVPPPVSALGFKVAATAPVSSGVLASVASGAATVASGAAAVASIVLSFFGALGIMYTKEASSSGAA